MDEILATIRRIIADEEQPGAPASADTAADAAAGQAAVGGGPAEREKPAPREEVLELTEALNEDGSVRHLAPIGGAPQRPAEPPAPPRLAEPAAPAAPAEPFAPIEPPAPAAASLPGPAEPPGWMPAGVSAPSPVPADEAAGAMPPHPPAAATDERIVSDVASFAAAAAFAHLAQLPRGSGADREMPRIGDRTLEDLVSELLRPLLRAWLDDNLPQLVARLVQAEIARVVRRSGVD